MLAAASLVDLRATVADRAKAGIVKNSVPQVTLAVWIIKIAATTTSDHLTRTAGLGYLCKND